VTDDLRSRLARLPTEELVEILRAQDLENWRPEVFPIVEALLRERVVDPALVPREEAPPQADFESLEPVASFGDAMEAKLCRMALGEAGIEAWLSTEHLAGVAPPLGLAIGIDLLVRPEMVAAAREVLASLAAGEAALPEENESCPRCQSSETEHIEGVDRGVAVANFVLVGYPRPHPVWRWKCNACGHEWE